MAFGGSSANRRLAPVKEGKVGIKPLNVRVVRHPTWIHLALRLDLAVFRHEQHRPRAHLQDFGCFAFVETFLFGGVHWGYPTNPPWLREIGDVRTPIPLRSEEHTS